MHNRYSNIPDEWEEPTPAEYTDSGDLRSWLLNPFCNDEYAVVVGEGKETVTTVYSGATDFKIRESREVSRPTRTPQIYKSHLIIDYIFKLIINIILYKLINILQ